MRLPTNRSTRRGSPTIGAGTGVRLEVHVRAAGSLTRRAHHVVDDGRKVEKLPKTELALALREGEQRFEQLLLLYRRGGYPLQRALEGRHGGLVVGGRDLGEQSQARER